MTSNDSSPSESEDRMKPKYGWIVALILMLCCLGFTIKAQKETSSRSNWEYRSVFSTSADVAYVLNSLGDQGWELVAIDVTTTDKDNSGIKGTTYFLKRSK
jgi:hypothetical protein